MTEESESSMTIGQVAYEIFCDSIGAHSQWEELDSGRHQAWEIATAEFLLRNITATTFYSSLKTEMERVAGGRVTDWKLPILQSRDFLYKQIQSLTEQLQQERELVDRQRGTYCGWLKDHHIPEDTEAPLQKEWMQTYFFSLSVKLPSGANIEFDTWGNDWYAWITDLNLLHQRRRLCLLKTRGDFRRLLQCFGVKDWECEENYDYE